MSFLSTAGNVGYSGLTQISDASCASQYKMAVEGVPAVCSNNVEPYSPERIDDNIYLPHINDNFFNTSKFRIESEEMYSFPESEVIADGATVVHLRKSPSPDNMAIINKSKKQDSLMEKLSNGIISTGCPANGHLETITSTSNMDGKSFTAKLPVAIKTLNRPNRELNRSNSISEILQSVDCLSPKSRITKSPSSTKTSISSVKENPPQFHQSSSNSESFLDVFKREMGSYAGAKEERRTSAPVATLNFDVKPVMSKKMPSGKPSPSTLRSRHGRGPEVHEALQRIPKTSPLAQPRTWHAPGDHLYQCGPLTDKKSLAVDTYSSSEDESDMPSFGSWVLTSADDAEAGGGEARGARLAARRATMRRQVVQAATALRLAPTHQPQARLASIIKKQLRSQSNPSSVKLGSQALTQLLASRGMSTMFNSKERRRLRSYGWSGGETEPSGATLCEAEDCSSAAMPCARYCLTHVTLASEQRLYTSCTAVFAGGARCRQPLLQLHDQTPLCLEHAWKRDNYDKKNREGKQQPTRTVPRKRPTSSSTNRRAKRRRRPPPARVAPPPPPSSSLEHSLSVPELNVCSNSSTYDSSEDTGIGGLSESEFLGNSHTSLDAGVVEEVLSAHQPPDDILDAAVLHQIPDEAFTEFFNQTDCPSGFAESEELARALEAVLDERALDSLADCVFTHTPASLQHRPTKMQLPASVGVEMSSNTPS